MVYLDYAATSLRKPEQVYAAVQSALRRSASAGRGGYREAEAAADFIFDCRVQLAGLFSLPNPERVAFTHNATMALNMAIKGMLPGPGRVVISGFEHNAVLRPLEAMARQGVRYTVAQAPLFDPRAQLAAFDRLIGPDTSLAVCVHVSNVFGYILPVEELDALCAQRGVPLIIDASQSAGTLALDVSALRAAAFVCMPGHKGLFGPQGTGVLLCLNPEAGTLIEGGTGSDSNSYAQPSFLPDRFESGTQNAAGIAGLREGVRFIRRTGLDHILSHETALIDQAARELSKIPGLRLYFAGHAEPEGEFQGISGKRVQTGVLSFYVEDLPCGDLAQALADGGVAVRAGLHCAPLAHRTAGSFEHGTVRISTSVFSTRQDI